MAIVASLCMYAQPKENVTEKESATEISCHEISVSIASIVTVNNFYICCGGHFMNAATLPPRPCSFVSKRTFNLFNGDSNRYSGAQSINIKDLIPDEETAKKLTEIVVVRSSAFDYDGRLSTIKPGKYLINHDGEVFFEIVTLK